jgi:hypothetical protein
MKQRNIIMSIILAPAQRRYLERQAELCGNSSLAAIVRQLITAAMQSEQGEPA